MATFLFYDDKIINILVKNETLSGGAAVQAYGWIRGLSEAGQHIVVMTAPCKKTLKEDCRDIQLVSLYNEGKGIRWLRWLYYRLPFIYREIKKVSPTYVFQGVPSWNTFLFALICKKLKIKFIVRISNDNFTDKRILQNHSRIFRFFMNKGLGMANYILCQNDYQYQRITKAFPRKNVIKIPNPIVLKERVADTATNARKYIAWLGLFQYQKNLPLLYDIACLLHQEEFLIAGKALDKCDATTLQYLEKLKQLPNIKFTGFLHREEVFPFLANAKFLLNTSHYEGFSNTFLEAMTVGTPIISPDKVNPDEIISQHHLGFVYSDLENLQQQFMAVTSESYDRMSQNARTYVRMQHDHNLLSKRLVNYLNEN
jgi:glycosyltransferase involved in cell wall biosynthesis